MSRCFPFPPPGYEFPLIESIKGVDEKARKDRKERGDGESSKHRHKRRRKEEGENDKNGPIREMRKKPENDCCLEKSSLTVEHEMVQSTSQNSCDSTVNSNDHLPKLRPHDVGRHDNNDSESVTRFRLPIPRQKDPEVMMTDKNQQKPCHSRDTREQPDSSHYPCSTSASEHTSKPHKEKTKDPIFTTKLGKEKKSSSSTPETSSLCSICPPSIAKQLSNLVEHWVPNTAEIGTEFTNSEDEERWLLAKKKPRSSIQLNRNNETTKQVISSSMAWPRARLLPEIDVHALPYTIPF